ncbi:MAG: ribosome-associated translation inhibitor RaiA [Ruminococcus sp.]|nr:ribosome-associated translation inhibitor RaiA [Ruminococcus sp.]
MKLTITAKKMQISPNFNTYAESKLNTKLDRFFEDGADAKITLAEQKNFIILELTVKSGTMIYRAEQSALDKNDALDAAIDKIIRQICKNKTKLGKLIRDGAFKEMNVDPVEEQVSYDVIKQKEFTLRPMSVDEAILQMNMLGHGFFMFLNAATGIINVVYRRDDGNYAVLVPKQA